MGDEIPGDSGESCVGRKRFKEALARCGLKSSKPGHVEAFADVCGSLAQRRGLSVSGTDHAGHLREVYDTKSPELAVPGHITAGVDEALAYQPRLIAGASG